MPKSSIITKNISHIEAMTARIAIWTGILYITLLVLLHILEPQFDPTWRFISEYQLGQFGWMMHLAFFLLATSLASTAFMVFSQARTVIGYIGLFLLGLAAIGISLSALFTTDPITISQQVATWSGKIHVLGASLDWSPVAFLLLSFSLTRNTNWLPIRRQLFIASSLTLIIMIAFVLSLPHDGKFGPGIYTGLIGRFLTVSYIGWILVSGTHILKSSKTYTSK